MTALVMRLTLDCSCPMSQSVAARPTTAVGISGLLIATLSWGGVFHITKRMLPEIDAFWQTGLRFSGSAVLLLLLLAATEGIKALRLDGRAKLATVYGALGYAGFNFLVFFGLNFTKAEHGAIIVGMMPILLVLVGWFAYRQRPGQVTLGCIVLAFAGILLVITRGSPAALAADHKAVLGDLIAVVGVLSYAVYTFGIQRFTGWSPLRFAALTMLMAQPVMLVVLVIASLAGIAHLPSLATVTDNATGLLFQIVFGTTAATLGWNLGIAALGPLIGVLFINLVPITAFTVGIVLGNRFVAAELVGAACVIAALLINNLHARRAMAKARQS